MALNSKPSPKDDETLPCWLVATTAAIAAQKPLTI